jgi:hypothetical protein
MLALLNDIVVLLAGVAAFHQVSMPSQHRVRADQQPESAQCHARQRRKQSREQRPVLGPQSWPLIAELSPQGRELMA